MSQPLFLEELAAALYEKYCVSVGGVAFNGDTLPNWSAFAADEKKKKQADAWRDVAAEAMRLIG